MDAGYLVASGHNWYVESITTILLGYECPKLIFFLSNRVEGQGSGPRIDKDDGEEVELFDALGNKLVSKKKKKADTSSDLRRKKKERMARKKAGLPSDDEEEL